MTSKAAQRQQKQPYDSSLDELPPLQNAALILIDFQNDFCSPGGYVDQNITSTTKTKLHNDDKEDHLAQTEDDAINDDADADADADVDNNLSWVCDEAIPNAQRLLQAARECNNSNNSNSDNKVLIVHTREGYASDLSDVSPCKLQRSKNGGCEIGSLGPLGRLLIRGEQGHDIIPELYPIQNGSMNEIVLDKPGYCAFRTTGKVDSQLDLHTILQSHNIKDLIVCGVTADVCVHTTIRTAIELGCYNKVLYVRDAISTPNPLIRKACELMIVEEGGIWGNVVTTDTAVEMLGSKT